MIYLLAVVTFLASIMFYSFYPRTDAIKLMDKPIAKIAATELITEHTAAMRAATVLYTENNQKKMQYQSWTQSTTPYPIAASVYNAYLPTGFVRSTTDGYESPRAYLVCVDNATGTLTNNCGVRNAGSATYGTTDFIITYISIDAIEQQFGRYIANLAPRALGEKEYLMAYNQDGTHTTTNCGILRSGAPHSGQDYDPNNANTVLDNTRYKTVSVPRAFSDLLSASHEYLVCITRVSVATDRTTCAAQTTQVNCTAQAAHGCYWNNDYGKCLSGIIYPQ